MKKIITVFLLFFSITSFANQYLGLPTIQYPSDNPSTDQKIALGFKIFHDKTFSKTQTISCASCHLESKSFTDGRAIAAGIYGLTGVRSAPTVVNTAFFHTLFVDGRENSLEAQALKPMLNPIEHGLTSEQQILEIALKNTHYKQQLQQIFNVSAPDITTAMIAKVIASYERSIISANSPFDQYYFGRDRSQLSQSAARGLLIFRRKGNCANCHEISWNQALFTDNRFYNIGIGFKPIQNQIKQQKITQANQLSSLSLTERQRPELGRFNITNNLTDVGQFKTPSLRNIALTAPYMHNGSLASLEDVVEYYDKGGDKNQWLDPAIFPLHLSNQEKHDLVNFMKSLTGSNYQ